MKNMEVNPFDKYIRKLFNLRLEYIKQNNNVGSNLIKLLMNSLYGRQYKKI